MQTIVAIENCCNRLPFSTLQFAEYQLSVHTRFLCISAFQTPNITFQSGLILYVEENTTNDFIALEFFDGNLYVVSSRSGMPRRAVRTQYRAVRTAVLLGTEGPNGQFPMHERHCVLYAL